MFRNTNILQGSKDYHLRIFSTDKFIFLRCRNIYFDSVYVIIKMLLVPLGEPSMQITARPNTRSGPWLNCSSAFRQVIPARLFPSGGISHGVLKNNPGAGACGLGTETEGPGRGKISPATRNRDPGRYYHTATEARLPQYLSRGRGKLPAAVLLQDQQGFGQGLNVPCWQN